MTDERLDDAIVTASEIRPYTIWQHIARPFADFLGIPVAIVTGSLVLATLVFALERANPPAVRAASEIVGQYLFPSSESSRAFVGTVAAGLITMTSLTISMLLLVLQQTAGNMGNLIYDQFLSRRRNQVYAGYIVATVAFTLFVHTTISDNFNPVLGATSVLFITILSLLLLLWFLYSTINQMRPEMIVETIRDRTLAARKRQSDLLRRTRRTPRMRTGPRVAVRSGASGYLVGIDLEQIEEALSHISAPVEIVLLVGLGSDVAYYDVVAKVRAARADLACEVAKSVGDALHLAYRRDLDVDAAFGLEQMETIAWTAMSAAKQNPGAPLTVVHAVRHVLRRWMLDESETSDQKVLPVVYVDQVPARAIGTLESLIVVSKNSLQHQVVATIYHTIAQLLPSLTPELRERALEAVVRSLPAIDRHPLTHGLDLALVTLADVVEGCGAGQVARALRQAREQQAQDLALSVGQPHRGLRASRPLEGASG